MRSKDLAVMENLSSHYPEDLTLEMFRRICLVRHFEMKVEKVYDSGRIKCPVYLSIGQEAVAPALSLSFPKPAIFAQHRCHDLYLSYGGQISALIDELLHQPTGCAGGMGGSASIHSPQINMFGHDGLMGTQIPIAVGYAMATNKKTLAVMGDASAEEDYVLGGLGFAATKKPPILFVCIDNGLSCLTPVCVRRNWNMAKDGAFGMPAIEITDDPWLIMHQIKSLSLKLPAFINIHTCRISSHSGTSKDRMKPPEWERFELVCEEMKKLGLARQAEEIQRSTQEMVDEIWQQRLGADQ